MNKQSFSTNKQSFSTNRVILHIDFNSYFATVEQQANPRLRGKPIGVTGGDRMKRTVLGAASVEAKRFGVKTGMQIWEAKRLCPQIILVNGDSDKYLETTKRFLNILKDYSPYLEVFSIDEAFIELSTNVIANPAKPDVAILIKKDSHVGPINIGTPRNDNEEAIKIAREIKSRIRSEIGEYISCSIGISYNKLMAKLAGSLIKPDGLVIIANEKEATKVLDTQPLDEICGIGHRIKKRLNKMGVFNFKQLRAVPLNLLLLEFKSYGHFLYNSARGIDDRPLNPFYKKAEVKSIGHRHTISHDVDNPEELKQLLLKLSEMVARRLRAKKLVGKTVSCWYRNALIYPEVSTYSTLRVEFRGGGMQATIPFTSDGLEIFKACWKIFHQIWPGGKVRMVGASISNLKPENPQNLSLLEEDLRQQKIVQTLDKINDRYGEFTLQRGILLKSAKMSRKPNPFLADRRFRI